jgi:hypothetical protein
MKRKLRTIFILAVFLLYGRSASPQTQVTATAIPACEFLNSIGVNTSINTRGENLPQTKTSAAYVGVRWFRSIPPDGTNLRVGHIYDLYYNAGIRFSFSLRSHGDPDAQNNYMGGIPFVIAKTKEVITTLGTKDALIAFEGCNEPNNWGVLYQGEYGAGEFDSGHPGPYSWKPLARYQRDFYAAVKADPVLNDIPVWSASDMGAAWENVGLHFLEIPEGAAGVDPEFPAGTKFADYACIHNYFGKAGSVANNHTWKMASPTDNVQNGLYQHHGLTWAEKYVGYSNEQLENLPRVTTETGSTINSYVTEEQQALLFLSCYLSQFKRGFKYTAMYILRDRNDESGNQTYGFFTTDYMPRRGAHYMHNLTTILDDDTSSVTLKSLNYTFNPYIPSTVHELLLQKNDGTLMLVVWGERYANGSVADNITVQFDRIFSKINVYNPAQYKSNDETIGLRPVATYDNANSVPLAVLNHPFILELKSETSGIEPTREKATAATVLYPNPVENEMEILSQAEVTRVTISDVTGKTVYYTAKPTGSIIRLGHLKKGVYFARLNFKGNKEETHKFIKL